MSTPPEKPAKPVRVVIVGHIGHVGLSRASKVAALQTALTAISHVEVAAQEDILSKPTTGAGVDWPELHQFQVLEEDSVPRSRYPSAFKSGKTYHDPLGRRGRRR